MAMAKKRLQKAMFPVFSRYMFTGIVREVGVLQKREKKDQNVTFTIHAPLLIVELKEGMSVSVNGACLTVEYLFRDAFKVTAVPETLEKTNLGKINVGSRVNLEPALSLGEKIDGHLVTGHIDSIGEVIAKEIISGGQMLKVRIPETLQKFIAAKGSVTLNGVSLTVVDIQEGILSVTLIPYTQQYTNFGDLRENDLINIEVDLVARYLDRLLSGNTRFITSV